MSQGDAIEKPDGGERTSQNDPEERQLCRDDNAGQEGRQHQNEDAAGRKMTL